MSERTEDGIDENTGELSRDLIGERTRRGLAAGFLACLPLLLAYELGLLGGVPPAWRNTAELVVGRVFAVLGDGEDLARRAVLVILGVGAWVHLRRREIAPLRTALRQSCEGLLAAIALGPVLMGLVGLFGVSLPELDPALAAERAAPGLPAVCRLVGGAVWEECLFRVGIYGVFFLLVRRLASFFGLGTAGSASLGELAALLGSSLAFAAFHLAAFTQALGFGGEPFDDRLFLWRVLAGLLLAGLLRWRGLGVAAWAHGLFNFALALGAGPGVLSGGP